MFYKTCDLFLISLLHTRKGFLPSPALSCVVIYFVLSILIEASLAFTLSLTFSLAGGRRSDRFNLNTTELMGTMFLFIYRHELHL